MSKTQNDNTLQNDSVDSGSITFKIGGLISRLKHLQKIGDITIVNTSIKELDYSKALKEYEELNKIAKKTTQFSSPADQAAFLFNLNKCQAIIDFRVFDEHKTHLKLDEHKKHLSKAYKDYNPGRNQSIIELGQWNTRYKELLPAEQQKKMFANSVSATSLLDEHFKNLTTAVNSHLKQKEYTEALKEMNGLEKIINSKVVSLYFGIYIAAGNPSEALKHCTDTMNYAGEDVQIKENYCKFYKSLEDRFKEVGATAQANEAAKIAESYKPETEHQKFMTLSREQQATNDKLSMELARQKQEAKELADKYAAAIKKLTDIETKQIIVTKQQELQAKQDAELEIFEAEFKAQQQNQFQVKKEQINALTKTEPSAPFELPPTYISATKTTKGHQILSVAKPKEHQNFYPFDMLNAIIPTTNTGTAYVATTIKDSTKNTTTSTRTGPVITIIEDNAEDTATSAGTGPVVTTIKGSTKDTTTSTGTSSVITTIQNATSAGDGSIVTIDDSKDTEITTIEPIVINVAQAEVDEITTILRSGKPNMEDRVARYWEKAIGKQDNLYKMIDNPVILPSLASKYFKLGQLVEAKKTVNKIIKDAEKNKKNAYDGIEDSDVLNLIAAKYNKKGFLEESIEACKKAALQPGYTPCAESYQLLNEIGETKKLTNKELALEALKVAKGHAADDLDKYHIHMTIIKMHSTSKNSGDAKKEYTELLNNVPYETILKLANTDEKVQHLLAVDDELTKYKLFLDKYKANPTLDNASYFYNEVLGFNKCEIKLAGIMQANVKAHHQGGTNAIQTLINGNLGNKIILRLNKCYDEWYAKTTSNEPLETYVKAIGDIDHCLFGE
ncbi:MAG: hypothetical protein LN568_00650 [Rickettsia endosymbiont of Pseudomimeciton antennatum]|nr:hypothetical protein [Rickettsia endosymbiont of Pseudomimeciton antennatum]